VSFSKAQDLICLANLASRRRGICLVEIGQVFECSHRTAQRMTVALETAFPATVQRTDDDDRRTYWVLPTRPAVHLLTPTADELAALSAAVDALRRDTMTTEASLLRRLDAKVRALIPPPQAARLEVDEEALLEALGHAVRPGPRPASNPKVDQAIFEALKGMSQLRIVYRGRHDNTARERVVAPHGLLLGVRRYLVARDQSKPGAGLRHYRVEEIESAEVLPESVQLDAGFNIHDYAQRGFGSFVNDDEYEEVVWKFRPHAVAQARRFQFHPSQVLEDTEDGGLIVRFMAAGHLEMCWHLYAWGDSVEVLAPQALREMTLRYRRADFAALP
jgi:predicted DNA-binding transcriptional regulator YafY